MSLEIIDIQSSLIKSIGYDEETKRLAVIFKNQDWQKDIVFINVPKSLTEQFLNSKSKGNFFLSKIQNKYQVMAKQTYDKVFEARIDVTKINKDWLFKGEKGVYMDVTLFYKEKPDEYKTNGFVSQKVPQDVKKAEPNTFGPVLGNVKDWSTQRTVNPEATPGVEISNNGIGVGETEEYKDDLPF